MKLRITFGAAGDRKCIEHQWDYNGKFEDNMRRATLAAMDSGMTLDELRNGTADIMAVKEHDGETCPCCGRELK